MRLFDNTWFNSVFKRSRENQWIDYVMDQINGSGKIYIDTLRIWFERFPVSNKHKKHLKNRLESFNNSDHLGGVNEIAWWEFINSLGWTAKPIDAGKGNTPDFNITKPEDFFCEITTLNMSEKERKLIGSVGVALDHNRSIKRIMKKVVSEKAGQIEYGASRKRPSFLVLFDYSFPSHFETRFYYDLANFLFGDTLGFMKLPTELSGVVYVERNVDIEGKIYISKDRSAVYHNPNSLYKVSDSVFQMIRQYKIQMKEIPAMVRQNEPVYWLS